MKKIRKPCGLHCIRINNMGVRFADREVLKDINLHIHCGTMTAIIGRNGAGKSTFIRAILNEIPHEGEITFRNTENGQVKHLRIGYVPQSINIEKNTPMDVYDLIAAFRYRTPVFLKRKQTEEEIREALSEFAAAEFIHKSIGNLSGGELQRVLLSMAVMDEPDLLLLDEPVSGIDKNGMDLFYEKMKYLKENHDLAVVIISHDLDYVAKYADKVVLMDQTVLSEGTPEEVYQSKAFREVFGNTGYGFPKSVKLPHAGRRSTQSAEPPYDPSYRHKEVVK